MNKICESCDIMFSIDIGKQAYILGEQAYSLCGLLSQKLCKF